MTRSTSKVPLTILVWTDDEILVEFVRMTKDDAALRAETLAVGNGEEDDHAWQVLDGHVKVHARTGRGER